MKWLITILAGASLAACGGKAATVEPVRYDLGSLTGNWSGSRIPIAAIDVRAAPWLSESAMHFRLAYAEPLQRRTYAESGWAAPPAELLEAFLKRRIIFGQPEFSGTGCRLQLVVDEFEQRFDELHKSHAVIEVRALLTALRGDQVLSRKAFLVQKPAPTADARGGAAAARDAAQVLADDLGNWLGEISRDRPAIVDRCRIT